MLAPQQRDQLRKMYLDAWAKRDQIEQLTDLERMIVDVCSMHPEYHVVLEGGEAVLETDFTPEGGQTNPFLHMGMHIAIREQLTTDRPAGYRDAYQAVMNKLGDAHAAEHQIMECLGQALWEAQNQSRAPDEQAYLECVRSLV